MSEWMKIAWVGVSIVVLGVGCVTVNDPVSAGANAAGPVPGTRAYYEQNIRGYYALDRDVLVRIAGMIPSAVAEPPVLPGVIRATTLVMPSAQKMEGRVLQVLSNNLVVVGKPVTNVSGAVTFPRSCLIVMAGNRSHVEGDWRQLLVVSEEDYTFATRSGVTGTLSSYREVTEPTFDEYRNIYESDSQAVPDAPLVSVARWTNVPSRAIRVPPPAVPSMAATIPAVGPARLSPEEDAKLVAAGVLPALSAKPVLVPAVTSPEAVAAEGGKPANSLQIGDLAPRLLQGKYVQGEPVSSLETGKVYVVEFWATWCGPCRKAIPHLNALHEKYKDKGLVVIGQNVWERGNDIEASVTTFVGQMGSNMTYRVALDEGAGNVGKMAETWMKAAGRRGVPAAFVVNQSGRIAWMGHPMSGLDEVVEKVLAGTFDIEKAKQDQARKAAERTVPQPAEIVKPNRAAGDDLQALATIIASPRPTLRLPDDGLLARFPLRDNFSDDSGTNATFTAQRTTFANGALYLNGVYIYSGSSTQGCSAGAQVPDMSYMRFSIALQFLPIDFGSRDVIFMCGPSYRWFGVVADAKGALSISANNGRQRFPIGVTVGARQWHHLVCSVNLEARTILVSCDGKLAQPIQLPVDFKFDVVGSVRENSDKGVEFTDYSCGAVFHGFVGELRVYARSLAAGEMGEK